MRTFSCACLENNKERCYIYDNILHPDWLRGVQLWWKGRRASAVQTPGFSPPAPAKKSPAPAKKSPAPASGKITPARQKISSPGKFVKIRNWMEISFYISKWKHSLSFRCYCRCPKEFAAQSMYCRSFAGVEQTPAPARLRQNRPKLRLRHSGSGAQH